MVCNRALTRLYGIFTQYTQNQTQLTGADVDGTDIVFIRSFGKACCRLLVQMSYRFKNFFKWPFNQR
jgi:hypothetical protein